MRLPGQGKDGERKLRAKHVDSPSVPNELRHEHERRKLSSEYRLYDFGVLRDLWTDPVRLHLCRAAGAREVDDDAAEPMSLSACVSIETFGEIVRALTSRLRAELQELGKPDLMQLSKGRAWHRYAVMRLERVFSKFYASQELRELSPGPNQMIAALINAAVPNSTTAPVSLRYVSETRTRLSNKLATREDR